MISEIFALDQRGRIQSSVLPYYDLLCLILVIQYEKPILPMIVNL